MSDKDTLCRPELFLTREERNWEYCDCTPIPLECYKHPTPDGNAIVVEGRVVWR